MLCRDEESMKIPAGGGLTARGHTRPSFLPYPICAPNVVRPFMRAAGRPHELLELAAVPPNLILCHDHEIGHVAVEVEQLQGRGDGGGGGGRDARWNRSQRSQTECTHVALLTRCWRMALRKSLRSCASVRRGWIRTL